jgi:hypothetical protein
LTLPEAEHGSLDLLLSSTLLQLIKARGLPVENNSPFKLQIQSHTSRRPATPIRKSQFEAPLEAAKNK